MKKSVTPRILEKVYSLSDIRQHVRAGNQRYEQLAKIAADNLGGPADSFESAMETLETNALEIEMEIECSNGEETVLDEINNVRDIELDNFKKGIVR